MKDVNQDTPVTHTIGVYHPDSKSVWVYPFYLGTKDECEKRAESMSTVAVRYSAIALKDLE